MAALRIFRQPRIIRPSLRGIGSRAVLFQGTSVGLGRHEAANGPSTSSLSPVNS
jgi:hypothetical protein